jgi:hypothetical protein
MRRRRGPLEGRRGSPRRRLRVPAVAKEVRCAGLGLRLQRLLLLLLVLLARLLRRWRRRLGAPVAKQARGGLRLGGGLCVTERGQKPLFHAQEVVCVRRARLLRPRRRRSEAKCGSPRGAQGGATACGSGAAGERQRGRRARALQESRPPLRALVRNAEAREAAQWISGTCWGGIELSGS